MTIHPTGSIFLPLKNLSLNVQRIGEKKKTRHFKYNQKVAEESLNQDAEAKLQRRGLKRLQEQGLKV